MSVRRQLIRRIDPRGKSYFWIGGDAPSGVVEEGTDYGAMMAGYISISPIQLDLTAHSYLENLRGRVQEWNFR